MKGKIPVAMFWLNTKNEEIGFIYPNHSSKFDIYEKVLYIGSATLVGTVLSFLKE